MRIFITAQEILVDHASYPTDKIALNSHKFRPLGPGLRQPRQPADGLGPALRLGRGPGPGRVDHGHHARPGYLTSSEHAEHVGPFDGFALNREPMLKVMEMHRDAAEAIDASAPADLRAEPPARSGPSASTMAASTAIATAR